MTNKKIYFSNIVDNKKPKKNPNKITKTPTY